MARFGQNLQDFSLASRHRLVGPEVLNLDLRLRHSDFEGEVFRVYGKVLEGEALNLTGSSQGIREYTP